MTSKSINPHSPFCNGKPTGLLPELWFCCKLNVWCRFLTIIYLSTAKEKAGVAALNSAYNITSKQMHLTLGFLALFGTEMNLQGLSSDIHWFYLSFNTAVLRLVIYWNLRNYICLHGVFSLTAQYSFLYYLSFFIACVLKSLNLVQTLRLKAVDFCKVKMNKFLQSSLSICLQASTDTKVAEEICFFLLHILLCAACWSCFPPFNFLF